MWTTTKASSEANIKSCRMRSFMFAVHITKHTHTRCGWVAFFCCVSCFTLCVLLCVCVLLFVLYRSYSHFVYRCDFFPLFFSYCFCLFPHSSNAFGSRIKSATFAQIHIYIYSFWYSIFPPLMCLNIQCLAFFFSCYGYDGHCCNCRCCCPFSFILNTYSTYLNMNMNIYIYK